MEFSYYRERVDSGGKRQRRVPVAAVDPTARARRLAEMRINSGGCSARSPVSPAAPPRNSGVVGDDSVGDTSAPRPRDASPVRESLTDRVKRVRAQFQTSHKRASHFFAVSAWRRRRPRIFDEPLATPTHCVANRKEQGDDRPDILTRTFAFLRHLTQSTAGNHRCGHLPLWLVEL